MKRLLSAISVAALLMLSGCVDRTGEAVDVIGGADGPTTMVVAEQTSSESEYEDFFCEMYVDELINKYTQLSNDWTAFDEAYYSEDADIDEVMTTVDKIISTLESIIAIEAPATFASYHQSVIDGAQYEIKYYSIFRNACLMAKGEASFSEQEMEEMNIFLEEHTNAETLPLNDAFNAVIEAATS